MPPAHQQRHERLADRPRRAGHEDLHRVLPVNDESVSMAFLLILEALSPVERAVFLLREAVDYAYDEIAQIVQKSEDNCRQIFARAKRHIDAGKRRFEPSPEKRAEIADRFFAACQEGELSGLVQVLAADAAFYGDGGGKAMAFVRPVVGADRVSRLLAGVYSKLAGSGVRIERVEVNGQPGARLLHLGPVSELLSPARLRHAGARGD
jgi:RNA polymerase sigma-70 factor (ECF subfamily)